MSTSAGVFTLVGRPDVLAIAWKMVRERGVLGKIYGSALFAR